MSDGPVHLLDHAASTPMRPAAVEAFTRAARDLTGNPSGVHSPARSARRALDDARDQVADVLGAQPGEVVFTSGGTEAADLAVLGVADAVDGVPACSAVEHPAVLRPVEARGGPVIGVDAHGRLDLDALTAAVDGRRLAVLSVMAANNETGVVNDLDAVAAALHRASPGTPLHTDAVAAAAWVDLRDHAAPADLVSVSGHKVGGPKGIGALVVRAGTPLAPRLLGGGQERERRGGTPNLAGAVAFAVALAEAAAEREATVARVRALAERLRAGLGTAVPDAVFTTPADPALHTGGTVHLCIPGVDREPLVFLLDEAGVAAAHGSSCASGAAEPSHVLAAMGVPADLARGALRLSLGWCSTDADVDAALAAVPAAVAHLRDGAPSPRSVPARGTGGATAASVPAPAGAPGGAVG